MSDKIDYNEILEKKLPEYKGVDLPSEYRDAVS